MIPALSHASVTTRFDAHWHIIGSTIEGTNDDEARTVAMNLTPIVSFRMLPSHSVSVGDSWKNEWKEALRSEGATAAGKVDTNVLYTLHDVSACGVLRCATVVGDGTDTIPSQTGMTGTSVFHGEERIDLVDFLPVSKVIESTTITRGSHDGQAFEEMNSVMVHIRRMSP